ncbi:MAG TPA: hypothetical protein VFB52_14590, partial [Solirubrobacterales bacterium]|nr:hypothetical protein [Solirubrobacterales bacterium]
MTDALLSATPASPPLDLEPEVLALGRELGQQRFSLRTAKRGAHDRAMALVSSDEQLRAALFRLVDVAPACAGPPELAAHLAAYLDDVEDEALPVALGHRAADSRALSRASGRFASAMVRQMAGRFIVGESIPDAEPVLSRLWRQGTAVTVDLLGEATVTHAEGQVYADRCDEALHLLALASARWPDCPLLEGDAIGPVPR